MLRIDAVTAGYGHTTVLHDVTVVVPDGSVVAMLGPNGAGKTTLLRVASGLLVPWSGRLIVDGTDATGASPHRLRSLGVCLVPEGRGIFPSLTVRENLRLCCRAGQETSGLERARESFPVLGKRLEQIAGTMSGGEQQMLALARAYAGDARVVLLDEVSMGLAPKVVDEIFAFLARLAAEGISLLLVEQYVSKAMAIADYVCLLDRGALSFVGEPAELSESTILANYLGAEAVGA
ncbi:MAG: ABC transporter ATP-binding protein [Actinobacteria bacterium]|nr:ABC transporter ATP-binding protein [Actinomycetota bacterium]